MPACLMDRPFIGWLRKRKTERAGRASRFFSGTNRRFFTLDFPRQLLYYSHSTRQKHISWPILFRDMLGVELLSLALETERAEPCSGADSDGAAAPVKRSDSKASVASLVSRISVPGVSARRPRAEPGFVLRYARSAQERSMQLLCGSQAEALQWVAALTAAMQHARAAPEDEAAPLEDLSTDEGPGSSDGASSGED